MINKKKCRYVFTILCILSIMFVFTACKNNGQGVDDESAAETLTEDNRAYVLETAANAMLQMNPQLMPGESGGDWVMFGLARWNGEVSQDWFDSYYEQIEDYVKKCKGVLHEKKYTEYSRTILVLTAMGKDPSDVAGYNLLEPLADFEQTVFQGVNGPVYALLALDSGRYEIPENKADSTQATREMYLDYILSKESEGGGWSLGGGAAEIDLTAMTLQALAKYGDRQDVAEAVERGLTFLSEQQDENGGYWAYDVENSESVAQVIVALTELGIGMDDARFVKNGKTLEDRLMDFQVEAGAFQHTLDGDINAMATEQAFYALVALQRAEDGRTTLYDMSDVK